MQFDKLLFAPAGAGKTLRAHGLWFVRTHPTHSENLRLNTSIFCYAQVYIFQIIGV